jgi:hypothetical protein
MTNNKDINKITIRHEKENNIFEVDDKKDDKYFTLILKGFKKNNEKINPKDEDRIIFLHASKNDIQEYVIDIDEDDNGGLPMAYPVIDNILIDPMGLFDNGHGKGGKKTKRKIKKSRKKSLKKKSRKMKKIKKKSRKMKKN